LDHPDTDRALDLRHAVLSGDALPEFEIWH
jgi:hypothetical protein